MSESTTTGKVAVGTYWEPATWDLARSAYIADLDTDPTSPGSFVGWLQQALRSHLDRTTAARTALQIVPPQRKQNQGPAKLNKTFPLEAGLVEDLEAAIVDERVNGRVISRSGFVHEAVTVAAGKARIRLGKDLPPPPARLPNRPPR